MTIDNGQVAPSGATAPVETRKERRARQFRERYAADPDTHRRRARESYHRKKEQYQAKRRDAEMLRKYGMTREEYDVLAAIQNGTCAICDGPPVGPGSRLHIDHDHITGRVRGLLCSLCNTAIGLLKDDPNLLRKTINYLEGTAT